MLQNILGFVSAAANAVWSVVGIMSEQEPRHEVVAHVGDVEIRTYAPRLAAETLVPGEESAARGEGFNRLAGYIFGGNKGARRIAMTTPVAQEPARIAMTTPVAQESTPQGWRIRFFLPADITVDTAPEPRDPRVSISPVPAETVAVLRFSGSTGPAAVAQQTATLLAALQGSKWQPAGSPLAWFYNPPWTLPALRRNEVAIPVTPAA